MTNNTVWFVTGGSKGLGLVLARTLAERGAKVAVTTRTSETLELRGENVLGLEVNLLDEQSVKRAVQKTLERFGRIDVVVNNAGYGQMGAVEEVSDAEARANFDVNVFGVLNVLRAVLPSMRKQRSGHVFNIASIGGFVGGFPGWGIYCATKFAVAALTEGLKEELSPFGIRSTVVYPGYFRTEFLARGSIATPSAPIDGYDAVRATERAHTVDINHQQPGDPQKLAKVLIDVAAQPKPPLHLFLGSDAVKMAHQKLGTLQQALAETDAVSRSTDF